MRFIRHLCKCLDLVNTTKSLLLVLDVGVKDVDPPIKSKYLLE